MPLAYDYFIKTTTIVGAASDSNDGHDPLGCALVNASYDHTGGGSGERQLTAASGTPFANVQAGDLIWLMNAAGGVAAGLYEIASKISSTVVLLTADSGLTSDSTGDVDSSSGPWLTPAKLFSTAAAGDRVIICADGGGTGNAWTLSATITPTQDGGTSGIVYQGGNSRGVVDGTMAKFIPDGALFGSILSFTNDTDSLAFIDLEFADTITDAVNQTSTAQYITWIRCSFHDANGRGLKADGIYTQVIDCEFYGNTTGLSLANACQTFRSRIHDNSGYGVDASGNGAIISGCLIYDNGAAGINSSSKAPSIIDSNTIFGNTSDGIYIYGSAIVNSVLGVITNNVIRSNGGYGINLSTTTRMPLVIDYNCIHNNTSGATSNCENMLGSHNVYSNPLFVSETDGSEDFDLQTSSPCINAGLAVPDK